MSAGNPWFVKPDVSRIDLKWNAPDGKSHTFWIEVKSELTIGEERAMLRSVSNITTDIRPSGQGEANTPSAGFDWTEYSFARMLRYIVDWSLEDEKNNKLKISRDVMGSFHKSLFDLIDNSVEAHVDSGGAEKKPKSVKRKR
jgi:hypothetical protein